jgi:prepilin signal peptidase PulO-like enzyme (type II secretory pathway)
MKKIYALIISLAVITPIVSFALLQGTVELLKSVRSIMNMIIPIMAGLAVVYFFWGMGQFILHSGDPKTHEDGKQQMIWGVIALFVIFSIFGIVSFISDATGIQTSGTRGSGSTTCALGDLNCGDGTGNGN